MIYLKIEDSFNAAAHHCAFCDATSQSHKDRRVFSAKGDASSIFICDKCLLELYSVIDHEAAQTDILNYNKTSTIKKNKVCPVCGSSDISYEPAQHYINSAPTNPNGLWGCGNCGWTSDEKEAPIQFKPGGVNTTEEEAPIRFKPWGFNTDNYVPPGSFELPSLEDREFDSSAIKGGTFYGRNKLRS